MEVRTLRQIEAESRTEKKRLVAAAAVLVFSAAIALATGLANRRHLAKEIAMWAIRHGHAVMNQDYGLVRATWNVPINYARSLRSAGAIPKLIVDIKFKDFRVLEKKREEALEKGFLFKDSDDFLPAFVRVDGKAVKVKLRLKGDLNDHLQGKKWSYRIKVEGNDNVFGLKVFSIQNPSTRAFQAQPMLFEALRKHGVLTPRYFFVDVTVNGNDVGIMALEEHFTREFLESQGRRDGVILKFDESLFFEEWHALGEKGNVFNSFRNAGIAAFENGRIEKSDRLRKDYAVAVGLLRGFVEGKLAASEVFDAALMGRFLAATELWGGTHSLFWNNIRFYFNPETGKLEPICYDSYRMILASDSFHLLATEEPMIGSLLSDRRIHESYAAAFDEISGEMNEKGIPVEQKRSNDRYLSILRNEFVYLENFPFDRMLARARKPPVSPEEYGRMLNEARDRKSRALSPDEYPALLHARIVRDRGIFLELGNAVPERVEVRSIDWISRSDDRVIPLRPESSIRYPMPLLPTPPGSLPRVERVKLRPPGEAADCDLRITAALPGGDRRYETVAKASFPALSRRPGPAPGTTAARRD